MLTVRHKIVESDKKIHGVFTEDLAADLLTELLPLSHGGGQGSTERPLRLADLLPARFGPQPGPDEGEEAGEQPLGADGLQQVRDDGVVQQGNSVLQGDILGGKIIINNPLKYQATSYITCSNGFWSFLIMILALMRPRNLMREST